MPKPNNTIESLMKRVTIQPNGCWVWTGRVNHKGYGKTSWQGKDKRVHRIFYEHHHGPIPEGLQVCHRCDNPPCCNPDHLFAGTALDNEWDKIAKGRRPMGQATCGKLNNSERKPEWKPGLPGKFSWSLDGRWTFNPIDDSVSH
jgi:HNH endonuclease